MDINVHFNWPNFLLGNYCGLTFVGINALEYKNEFILFYGGSTIRKQSTLNNPAEEI